MSSGVPSEVRQRYLVLFESFSRGGLGPGDFCRGFLEMWRSDRDTGVTTDEEVDRVMTAVDCYDPDPSLPHEIGELELRAEVSRAANQMASRPVSEG